MRNREIIRDVFKRYYLTNDIIAYKVTESDAIKYQKKEQVLAYNNIEEDKNGVLTVSGEPKQMYITDNKKWSTKMLQWHAKHGTRYKLGTVGIATEKAVGVFELVKYQIID